MRRRDFIAGLSATAWPVAVRAQSAIPLVGVLDVGVPRPDAPVLVAFRQGLADAGYIAGRNVAIEYRWANYQGQLQAGLATDLVRRQPAVIVATGAISTAYAAKGATSTIPIVFATGGDPVRYGLVVSTNRPGGNLTGLSLLTNQIAAKRLDLLSKLFKQIKVIGFLSPGARVLTYEEQRSDLLGAARALGLQVIIAEAYSDRDFEPAFAMFMERGAEALVVGNAPFVFPVPRNRAKIIELAVRHKLPAIYPDRADAVAGGLMSYSADTAASYRQLGSLYVAQILKGAKPSDLPVQQPTKFDFIINLKTAKAMGLEIPPILLVQAGEVIE
jgi:putative ABC transport system substrate-binding protein